MKKEMLYGFLLALTSLSMNSSLAACPGSPCSDHPQGVSVIAKNNCLQNGKVFFKRAGGGAATVPVDARSSKRICCDSNTPITFVIPGHSEKATTCPRSGCNIELVVGCPNKNK